MKPVKSHILLSVFCAFLSLGIFCRAEESAGGVVPLEINAPSYSFDPDTKVGRATCDSSSPRSDTNVVRITYQGIELTADEVELNTGTADVSAKGNVVLQRGDAVWRGETISGNFRSKHFTCGEFDVKSGVWYGHGAGAEHKENGDVVLGPTLMTTCDYEHPHYTINAKRVIHYNDGKFRAYHAVAKVGPVPVFYWPILFGDTRGDGGNIEIKPGYSSDWGAFLLLGRSWRIGEMGRTKMMLHFRSKNGIAIGNKTQLHGDTWETHALAYGMRDNDAPQTGSGDFNRRFDSENDRFRLNLYHRQEFYDDLTVRLNLDYLSDIDMLDDWFPREHDAIAQTYSYLDATYNSDRYSLAINARPRLNDFYSVVERLPEISLEMPRQPLLDLPLFYQSRTTLGFYEMRWREFDLPLGPGLEPLMAEEYDSWRMDTFHAVYSQHALGHGVQLIPRAGIRLTWYSDSSDQQMNDSLLGALIDHDNPDSEIYPFSSLTNYDNEGSGLTRISGELGFELNTKLYRVWDDYRNATLEMNGARHVVQPYVNYTFIPEPSEDKEDIYFFDEVDRISEQNFARFGVNQRVQTRRHGRVYTVARMQTYADFHFKRQEYYDEQGKVQSHDHAGALGNRIEFAPKPGVAFWNAVVVDMGEGELTRGEVGVKVGKDERKQVSLSYIFRSDYYSRVATSMASSLLDFSGEGTFIARHYNESQSLNAEIRFPINEKTLGRIRLDFDLVEGRLNYQLYEMLRDMHCWMGGLQLIEDNNEFQIMLVLYLKAFPSVGLSAGS